MSGLTKGHIDIQADQRPDNAGGVIRDSLVVAQTDDPHGGKGIRLGVRIQDNQDIVEFSINGFHLWPNFFRLSLDRDLIETFRPGKGERWVGFEIPRAHVPTANRQIRTTFHLAPAPVADQTIWWVVVYADESFSKWHADGTSVVHPV